MATQPTPNSPPTADPLIDEVRALRRTISDFYGNDVDRLYEHLRDVQCQYASRGVSQKRARGSETRKPTDSQ